MDLKGGKEAVLRGAVTEVPGGGGGTHFQASVQSRGSGASSGVRNHGQKDRAGVAWRMGRGEAGSACGVFAENPAAWSRDLPHQVDSGSHTGKCQDVPFPV